MKKKIRVGLLFGGESPEHEISIRSAATVFELLDRKRYRVMPIGITRRGKWKTARNPKQSLRSILASGEPFYSWGELPRKIDVVFPCLHGPLGEDGTVQGLCELLNLPYVGCGVLASALGMDKSLQKRLLRERGIPVLPAHDFERWEWKERKNDMVAAIRNQVGYPVFVKPARGGSSVGVSFVESEGKLVRAIQEAFRYDSKLVVEEAIPHAREFEVAVLGNQEPEVSLVGESIPSNAFYDYQAKYEKPSGRRIPAEIPSAAARRMQSLSVLAYRSLDCKGFARVDFLANADVSQIVVGEINTIPGLTSRSAFLKLWEAAGKAPAQVLHQLISLSFNW